MILLCIGCNFKKTTVDVREKLAFEGDKLQRALTDVSAAHECEAVILSTCNRVELYLAQSPGSRVLHVDDVVRFLAEFHNYPADEIRPHLYAHQQGEAIRHLFRVAASLDSLIIGEAQISGQVKRAYELAQEQTTTGPLLHSLFQRARQVAKRVRTETGIARGHVSISSAAVDYAREVFDQFDDKIVLVIGAGKMGELTLRHLKRLNPGRILVTNRSAEKAREIAQACEGEPITWDGLDEALVEADVVLSTTGAPEPIMTRERYRGIVARRTKDSIVILDIAVPRDFDSAIHDGETTFLFNIDDLTRIRESTLADRRKHVAPAEAIVEQEAKRFLKDLSKRRNGPLIGRLKQDVEAARCEILADLFSRLNGRLTEDERKDVEKAFELFGNRILHRPIAALNEEAPEETPQPSQHTLLDALAKLFRLED